MRRFPSPAGNAAKSNGDKRDKPVEDLILKLIHFRDLEKDIDKDQVRPNLGLGDELTFPACA